MRNPTPAPADRELPYEALLCAGHLLPGADSVTAGRHGGRGADLSAPWGRPPVPDPPPP